MKKAGFLGCAVLVALLATGCRNEQPGNPSDATGGNRNSLRVDSSGYNDNGQMNDTGEFSGDLDGGIPR